MAYPSRILQGRLGGVTLLSIVILSLSVESLSSGFSLDDYWILHDVQTMGVPWSSNWAGQSTFYRPLVIASYTLDLILFGPNPGGFHAVNIVLHMLTTALLFYLLVGTLRPLLDQRQKKTASPEILSLIVAMVFALHPANAHDVAWIPGRTDLLAGAFAVATLLCVLNGSKSRGPFARLLSLFLFVCALASKEIAVIIPVMVLVLVFWIQYARTRDGSEALRKGLRAVIPFAVILIAYLTFRLIVVPYTEGTLSWTDLPLDVAAKTLAKVLVLYVSPFEPIDLFYFFKDSTLLANVIGVSLIGTAWWLIREMMGAEKQQSAYALAMLIVGMPVFLLPNILHGWLLQRIMYVPLIGFSILILPVIAAFPWKHERFGGSRLLSVILVSFYVIVNAVGYTDTIGSWKKASLIETALARDILAAHEESRPIIVLTAPLRAGQVFVSSSFDYVLEYTANKRFGRYDSVYTAIHVIGSSHEDLRADIEVSPAGNTHRWIVTTSRPTQFLFPSVVGLQSRYGVAVLEVQKGEELENDLVTCRVLDTNDTDRAVALDVTIKDSLLAERSEMYVYQGSAMIRIR